MRKEADDTGPLAELEYWKHRTTKFSCLVDQIKTQPCRGVISTLNIAKAKIIKVWNVFSVCKCTNLIFLCSNGVSWTVELLMLPMKLVTI